MATAYRVDATAGDGQSATASSLALTIPASVAAGDVAYIAIGANSTSTTVTTPTGWTLKSGPDASGTVINCYLYERVLTAGDAGATVTLTLSVAQKAAAELVVISGGTTTGLVWGKNVDAGGATSVTVPTLAGVPAGALMVALFPRRNAAPPAPDVALPAGYTAGSRAANAHASGAQNSIEADWRSISSAGTYGGESAAVASSAGTAYAIAVPAVGGPPPPTRSGKANVWDGSAWVARTVKTWSGTAWVAHPAKAWDGAGWVVGK